MTGGFLLASLTRSQFAIDGKEHLRSPKVLRLLRRSGFFEKRKN